MQTRFVRAWIAIPAVLLSFVSSSVSQSGSGSGESGVVSSASTQATPSAKASQSASAKTALTPAITAAEIEAHVRFLAADERNGRMTGSAEARMCAEYLADVLQRQGLAPAGDAGTFLQRVPLVRTSVEGTPKMRMHLAGPDPVELVFGVDFDFRSPPRASEGLKLVVAKSAADLPAAADPKVALFVDASQRDRRTWLEDAKLGRGQGFGLLLVPGSTKAGKAREFEGSGEITRASAADGPVATVRMNGTALERLRSGTVRSIDVDGRAVHETIEGSNVVARIVGVRTPSKPDMARETLVVTAHYDHLDAGHAGGHATKPGADTIFNGADDDASGVAAVLEIAGAMAHEKPPARTVVFVLVTGEEIGLLGTEEYLDHPVVPLESTVANLNFEMIGRPDPKAGGVGHMWLTGFELTNLGAAFAAAKLAIEPDPYPQQSFYTRSDNIAFVHRGVIGQTLSSYNLHTDYHTPADEADKIDYVHMEGCTKAGLAAVRLIAAGELTPTWAEKPSSKRTPPR